MDGLELADALLQAIALQLKRARLSLDLLVGGGEFVGARGFEQRAADAIRAKPGGGGGEQLYGDRHGDDVVDRAEDSILVVAVPIVLQLRGVGKDQERTGGEDNGETTENSWSSPAHEHRGDDDGEDEQVVETEIREVDTMLNLRLGDDFPGDGGGEAEE